jgi:hypothetical protein
MDSEDSLVLRRLIWRRILDDRSIESCTIAGRPDGFGIAGHIIAAHDDRPLDVAYDICCGPDWAAQRATIEQVFDGAARRLEMARAKEGWPIDGVRDGRLDGCLEPDLGLTPSTNALAIQRLKLEIGQVAEINAAWVKFPALTTEPALQRYQRLGQRDYRYTNVGSGFTAVLTIDDLALPVSYEGIWTHIADWPGETS